MAQFVECLRGMGDACRALDFPIVSGNVSLYNESKATGGGSAILPTPAIGGVGLLEDWRTSVGIGLAGQGQEIWLVGDCDGHLGQSLWLRECFGREEGAAPAVDLEKERHHGWAIRTLIEQGMVDAVHDVADGGVAVALAEMALSGDVGAVVTSNVGNDYGGAKTKAEWWFGEDQSRYLVVAKRGAQLGHFLHHDQEAVRYGYRGKIGVTGGRVLRIDEAEISLADLRAAHEGFFPKLMGSELTPEF
jgi:phosphoribosylformylglycinamidine synthase